MFINKISQTINRLINR